jgi:hypothetical protein
MCGDVNDTLNMTYDIAVKRKPTFFRVCKVWGKNLPK